MKKQPSISQSDLALQRHLTLSRRNFLRGMGVTMALPMFESSITGALRAATAPDDATAIQTASTFLQKTLDKAMAQVGAARDMFENVLQEIKTVGSFRVRGLSSPQQVALVRSVKALRMSQVSDTALVVAASPAVELVLRQDYKDRIPSFQELQAVLDRCARDSAQN